MLHFSPHLFPLHLGLVFVLLHVRQVLVQEGGRLLLSVVLDLYHGCVLLVYYHGPVGFVNNHGALEGGLELLDLAALATALGPVVDDCLSLSSH